MREQNIYTDSGHNAAARMSAKDFKTMAVILESRHGIHAKGIAEFFASVHGNHGDSERCWAWGGVVATLERRSRERSDIQ